MVAVRCTWCPHAPVLHGTLLVCCWCANWVLEWASPVSANQMFSMSPSLTCIHLFSPCLYSFAHLSFLALKVSLTPPTLCVSPETKKPGQLGAPRVNAHSRSWLAAEAALLERGNQATSAGTAERKNRVKGKRSAKIPSVLVCDRKDVVQVCGYLSPAWESGLLLYYRREDRGGDWIQIARGFFYNEKYGIWTHRFKGKIKSSAFVSVL